jgi:hypothetical protein
MTVSFEDIRRDWVIRWDYPFSRGVRFLAAPRIVPSNALVNTNYNNISSINRRRSVLAPECPSGALFQRSAELLN